MNLASKWFAYGWRSIRVSSLVAWLGFAWACLGIADLVKSEFLPACYQSVQVVSYLPHLKFHIWIIIALIVLLVIIFDGGLKQLNAAISAMGHQNEEYGKERESLNREIAFRDKKLNDIITVNQPEITVHYLSDLLRFEESDLGNWTNKIVLVCPSAFSLRNEGHSTAYNIAIRQIVFERFYVTFALTGCLAPGKEQNVAAQVHCTNLDFRSSDQPSMSVMEIGYEGGGYIYFEAKQLGNGKIVELGRDLRTSITWADSSGNWFMRCSKSATGNDGHDWTTQFSPVKRIEAPLTEEEMQEAYAEDQFRTEN